MRTEFLRILWLGAGIFLVAMIGGGSARAVNLEVGIRHSFHEGPLLLDSLRYQNGVKETLSVTRLSYLLSGFAIQRADGEWVELGEQTAWMDVGSRRNSLRLTEIPAGPYRAIRFHFGPEALVNHGDTAHFPADHPLNPNLNGLHWSWQGGYIFLAVEGHFRAKDGEPKGYSYHLAGDANRVRIHLEAPLDLRHDGTIGLDFDLGILLNAPRTISFERDGSSTHSRKGDPLAEALVANLPGAFRVTQIRDNPLIVERVALGQALFQEVAFSRNGSISCASCHLAGQAFTDGRRVSVGVEGRAGNRNAMPLFNLAWKTRFFWDGRAASLREQALMPIADHAEMDETVERVTEKLAATSVYPPLFERAFGSPEVTAEKLGLALEQFMLTLTASHSKFDAALRGKAVLSEEEKRGFELFMTENDPRTGKAGADCFHCHGGTLLSDQQFHNNGLKPTSDLGRYGVTKVAADRGKFATPSLRNVARTGPYMHDGRFATLEEV
ncbi:MAG: cytochrome C peroxidase, partial [Verrucomicrobia bacterium]|nr:cytochrome C peroxidase [Verrucomicrobiota bacterium]